MSGVPALRWALASGGMPQASPEEPAWMTPGERSRLGRGIAKRRREHLLGRLTAKRLVARSHLELLGRPLGLDSFEIGVETSGAPFVRLPGDTPPPSLSISHSGEAAFCAVLWGGGFVGADLEKVDPRSEAFVRDFLAPEEIACWEEAPPGSGDLVATAIWSAKEAALKALRLGLTVDTRRVVCGRPGLDVSGSVWRPFEVRLDARLVKAGVSSGAGLLRGARRTWRGHVCTLVVLDRGGPPAAAAVLRQLEGAPSRAGGFDGQQVPAAAS